MFGVKIFSSFLLLLWPLAVSAEGVPGTCGAEVQKAIDSQFENRFGPPAPPARSERLSLPDQLFVEGKYGEAMAFYREAAKAGQSLALRRLGAFTNWESM